ncbi:hypothetical protein HY095_04655 [Candidatus Micrarchaeota archaeon]|nr:hypothetical protein [Candidatus Micrarchaeota archaeon]
MAEKRNLKCERCGRDAYYMEKCDYCSRNVCRPCQKSSLTASKTERKVICRDCWGDTKKRKAFKSA